MTRNEIARALDLSAAELEALDPQLDESLLCEPSTQPTLEPAFVAWAREFTGLPERYAEPLSAMARTIAADPALRALFWHQHRRAYELVDLPLQGCGQWPTLADRLGEHYGCYYLLLMFGVLPHMLARHAERGIPVAISRDCCSHFTASAELFALTGDGRLGVAPRVLYWLRNHLVGRLIRLGRFEYQLAGFTDRVTVYRRHADGAVVALAKAGELYNAEGYLDAGADTGWRSTWTETDTAVTANPVHPAGHTLPDPVTLDLREWQAVLAPGQIILETHIPRGGQMDLGAALDSMRRAPDFFRRHFPEQAFYGIATYSWILDPRVGEWLGEDSNMARWNRELYLYPCPSWGADGMYFVWGHDGPVPAHSPGETRLQRAYIDRIQAGGKVRSGGFFVLLEELDELGSQPYRRRWPFNL